MNLKIKNKRNLPALSQTSATKEDSDLSASNLFSFPTFH